MTTYLVTGGAGFIGSHIATRLVRDGHKVRVFDNLSTGSLDNLAHLAGKVEVVIGDVTDRDKVNEAIDGVDVVFHQAALASVPRSIDKPMDTHAACVTGTITLLDCCRLSNVKRVVYAGSSSAYGNQPVMPKHEGQVPQVLSPYAAAKLAGELYCESFAACYPLETVRIRYFNVFGPRQDPSSTYSGVISRFITSLLAGKGPTIHGDGEQTRDFTFVANVVDGVLRAATTPAATGGVFNAATGRRISINRLFYTLRDLIGANAEPEHGPARDGDVRDSQADITLAREVLGYTPLVEFEEGLRRTVEWYKEHC
jgi:UDP-glucose 4-epimerase